VAPQLRALYDDPRWNSFLSRVGLSNEALAEIPFHVKLPG